MALQAPSNFAPNDYSAEQQNIERQRRLSEALQGQAAQPLDVNQTAGGWAIPVSPFAGLAKALQGYSARKGMENADAREKALADKYSSDLAQTIASANQAAGPHAEPVDTSQEGTGSFDMSGTAGPATHIVPGSREKMIQALMQHPATQQMAMQQMSADLQRQGFMAAGAGASGAPTAAPAPNPMSQGPGASVMAGSGSQPAPAQPQQQGGQPVVFGGPAGGQPMALWLQMDPSGAKYVEQLAKDYAPISTRYGIFQKQPDGSMKAVGGALPQGALPYLPGGGVGLLPGQADASATLAGASASGRVPFEQGTTPSGAQMPNYMIPGFQQPPAPGAQTQPQPAPQPAAPAAAPSPASFPKETPAAAATANARQLDVLNGEAKSFTDKGQQVPPDLQREIDAAQKRVGGSTGYGQTTVGKERQASIAKSSDEYLNGLRSTASGAVEQNRILDDLQSNLNQVTPGKLAAVKKSVAEWKIGLGIGDDNDQKVAASSEVVDKLTGQLVSNALRKMSSKPSQMEFQVFLQKFVPNLNLTAQGAQQVVQFMRQANNLDAQKYDEFQTWKKSVPADSDYRDFDVYWNRKLGTAPLGSASSFPKNDVKDIVNSGTPPNYDALVSKYLGKPR